MILSRCWTEQELQSRQGIPAAFLEMVNSSCYRHVILRELGEYRLPAHVTRHTMSKERCCSAHNPQLFSPFPNPPSFDAPTGKPQKGSVPVEPFFVLFSRLCPGKPLGESREDITKWPRQTYRRQPWKCYLHSNGLASVWLLNWILK